MRTKILHFLAVTRPEFDFTESTNFISDGLLDSFDVVQLVAALDEAYEISIDGMDILPENFSSVDAIIQLLIKNGVKK